MSVEARPRWMGGASALPDRSQALPGQPALAAASEQSKPIVQSIPTLEMPALRHVRTETVHRIDRRKAVVAGCLGLVVALGLGAGLVVWERHHAASPVSAARPLALPAQPAKASTAPGAALHAVPLAPSLAPASARSASTHAAPLASPSERSESVAHDHAAKVSAAKPHRSVALDGRAPAKDDAWERTQSDRLDAFFHARKP